VRISDVPSCEITWGQLKELIDSHPDINDDSNIDSIRLKGAFNSVIVDTNKDNEITCGD
jgi:hypothetical protein